MKIGPFLMYRTPDIKYDRLFDEEKTVFAHICKKSPKIFNAMSPKEKDYAKARKEKEKITKEL